MKQKKLTFLQRVPVIVLGVLLGHGAQAYTVLDFESRPTNQNIVAPFGDNASESSDGVTVVGFGTPNIGLSWEASSGAAWQYYNDSVWTAAQLDNSTVGSTHTLGFVPNSTTAQVVVQSFNFHAYYESTERFTYRISLLAGTNVVSGPTDITFLSDSTKNHPVSINYTGAPGVTLSLRLERLPSTLGAGEVEGDPYDIAIDDITFGQLPESSLGVGPQVVTVSPSPGQTGVAGVFYPFQAGITNRDTSVVTNSIRLMLDGTPVSAAISAANGLTEVSYLATNLLAAGSPHTYTLVYEDNAAAKYTNDVQFTVANYATLPAEYGNPPGAGTERGFTYRTVAAPLEAADLASTVARARAQLNGTLTDTNTGLPYGNIATPGTNADGSFNIDGALNFSDNEFNAGNFPDDQLFPGLEAPPYDWFATEALLNLELPAGYYRLGVNSDDGFEFNAVPPEGVPGAPIQLGIYDNGRAADNTFFDFLVPAGGVYGFQLIYFESTGSASEELLSVDLASGELLLVNDPAVPTAIKSYRALSAAKPRITSIARNGTNLVIEWNRGTPPFQIQFTPTLSTPAWSNVGNTTTDRTATVPLQGDMGFFRVQGQ